MLLPISTAIGCFVVAVYLLRSEYLTVWPAPNFVTYSATYDHIYQSIGQSWIADGADTPLNIEFSVTPDKFAAEWKGSKIIDDTSDVCSDASDDTCQSGIIKKAPKQSTPYHLLHILPWALVPDRISHFDGSLSDLHAIYDTIWQHWKDVLGVATEWFDVSSSESLIRTHLEPLSPYMRDWIRNASTDLFNASQAIFAYQLHNYADEITEWVAQNSIVDEWGQSHPYMEGFQDLRFHFERSRGWPLFGNSADRIKFCQSIEGLSDDISLEECQTIVSRQLPWLPDRHLSDTLMWPPHFNASDDIHSLLSKDGINSPYTQVIRQNRKPSGEPLHYVSPDGKERIRVEWFDESLHLRATNVAFVRRMRHHIKAITTALESSISIAEVEEIKGLIYGSETNTKLVRNQRIPQRFQSFIEKYCAELEKGAFEEILKMDLSQDFEIFLHALPSIPVWNDGNIKRAWNLIVGMEPNSLIPNQLSVSRLPPRLNELFTVLEWDKSPIRSVELEITPVWPYVVGGWLRSVTPEIAIYTYPPLDDAVRMGKQRTVLLLDTLDKIYSNTMRQIAMHRWAEANDAHLLTLQSTAQYLSYLVELQHYFIDVTIDDPSFKNIVLSKVAAWFACYTSDEMTDDIYSCLLSGLFYNIVDGFVRDDISSQLFVIWLESVGMLQWSGDVAADAKMALNMDKLPSLFGPPLTQYFGQSSSSQLWNDEIISQLSNNDFMNKYRRMVRNVIKYSIIRRPGEDTYQL